jgi:hypothetical protein
MVRFIVGAGVTPAPLKVRTTLEVPTGVPALPPPPPPPPPLLLLPPPHEPMATAEAIASRASTVLHRRCREAKRANKNPMLKMQASAKLPASVRLPNDAGRLLDCGNANDFEGAVVWKVTVAIAELTVLLRATEDALQLHVVSEGMPEQRPDESGIVPLKPFTFENAMIAEPLPPGLLITTEVLLALVVKVGAAVTTSAVEAVEVA